MNIIQQRSPHDCVLASIAMAVGRTYDQCWTQEDLKSVVESKGIADWEPWLNKVGLKRGKEYLEMYCSELTEVHNFLWGRRALLSVSSLNNENGYHAVYWDGENLFDPSNAKAYTYLSSCRIRRVFLLKG